MAETHSHTPHAMAYSFPQQSIPHQISGPSAQTSHSTRGRGGGGGGGGEIVAVQGGHIVRSTGRKDRHSKVCTAKGPRDRRVRLSAHTAIQFYDVQDRLGYDRPSKAVDWLIKNAKDAIDKLAELPPWTPSNTCAAAGASAGSGRGVSTSPAIATSSLPLENQLISGVNPPFDFSASLDSDAIADTIKSFFPMGAASSSSAQGGRTIGFQSYSAEPLSRSGSQSTQDLRLSLQSFQDSMYHNHHQAGSTANLGFNSGSGSTLWPEPNQRIMQWSMPDTGTGGGVGAAGYSYNMPVQTQHHQASPMQNVLGQGQLFFQRGPLQSSNSPGVRSWADPIESESDHPMHQSGLYHHSVQSIGFGPGGSAGFSGFRIPARIQGEEEEHGGLPDKPPASSHH